MIGRIHGTWSGFIRWMIEHHPDSFDGDIVCLGNASEFVDDERSALAVMVAAGMQPAQFAELCAEWQQTSNAVGG